MKTKRFFSALALMAVAMSFASCSSDEEVSNAPSQKEIESKIIGKWKWTKCEGKDVLTNMRVVYSFYDGSKATCSLAAFDPMLKSYAWEKPNAFQI